VAATAPGVNHLLFADDSLLFFKASTKGARELKYVLVKYCNASGYGINTDKSSIFFSKRCPKIIKEGIKNELEVQLETLNEKYLGMPADVGEIKEWGIQISERPSLKESFGLAGTTTVGRRKGDSY
jgi:hypothetical protein